MKDGEELINGKFYHIYNCGINGENLFRESENYTSFLALMDKYILPVAELFAWVLMPNHFHLLARIKENVGYKYSIVDRDRMGQAWFDEHKWETIDLSACSREFGTDSIKKPMPHLHFSHFCNAYSKYYNKRYTRHGGLFERRFKRKHINHERYFKRMVLYIHNNPVHHGFCSHPIEYPWSSYLTCVSIKPTRLKRDSVLGWFDSEANFKLLHNEEIEIEKIEQWLGLND
jgi:REP element-mobilizing transposase RayT